MAEAHYPGHHEYRSPFGDTTYTKVFVGGLAWETPTDKMRAYFQQFGDILEAVIISDKNTGKSKGYGFVTFRDPAAATRACLDANPMIDGRRANCNIASFGRPRPSPPRGRNQGVVGVQGQASSTSYSGMPTSQQTLPTPFFYPYGYSYTPYSYQGLYNPQAQVQQTQQYYAQFYGGFPNPSTSTSSLGGPFYYGGYSFPLPSTTTPAHRITTPPYVYYPTQLEGAQFSPYPPTPTPNPNPAPPPTYASASASASSLPSAIPNNMHQVSSSTEESLAQQSTSVETDTGAIHSEGPST